MSLITDAPADTSTPTGDAPSNTPAPDAAKSDTSTPASDTAKPADKPADAPAGDKPADKPTEPTAEEKAAAEKAAADAKAATEKAAVDKHIEEQTKTITDLHKSWVEEVKADVEVGGEKLAENLAKAKAALEATATPKLIALLDKSGLGNHVEVIRHFLKIAPAFAEGKHVPGGKAPTGDSKSAERVLYPNNA
jgi:hypothetical protein